MAAGFTSIGGCERGEPWLLRRRILLFVIEGLGCTCWALKGLGEDVGAERRGAVPGTIFDAEDTVVCGLKVTILGDLGEFGGLNVVEDGGGRSGDLSVDAEAIALFWVVYPDGYKKGSLKLAVLLSCDMNILC